MKKISLLSVLLILASSASFADFPEVRGPDLTIAVGATVNPVNGTSIFNLVITNMGASDSPAPTRDKLILYYWGPSGQDPPRALKEVVTTPVPVIRTGEQYSHRIEYTFIRPGKYTYSAHVNIREMKTFDESDFLNNSILPAKELWISN